ncbi:MAG: hypothetical protein CSA36_07745 [Draconibacterium sp.]|nr:MAG: hypothetical protein CSA36_07745 [Draconibacterium sp.]
MKPYFILTKQMLSQSSRLGAFVFLILFLFVIETNAQDKKYGLTLNIGVNSQLIDFKPFPPSHGSKSIYELRLNPTAEVLANFSVLRKYRLYTGLGIEHGRHLALQHIAKLVYVDEFNSHPYQATYRWYLNYTSLYFPVYFEAPLNLFFENFYTGIRIGRLLKYNLSERSRDTSKVKVNRNYIEFGIGLKKAFTIIGQNFAVSPYVGYRKYTSDLNKFQKNYPFLEIKFSTNF